MPIPVQVYVEDPDLILNAGMFDAGAVVRAQWSATQTGTYASVGTKAIVSGTQTYTIFHALGTSSTWYRTRYENAGGTIPSGAEDNWCTPFQVGGEDAGNLCALGDVKQRLGINATDTTKDEMLSEFISRVSDGIMGYTGRRFARNPQSGTTTFLFDVRTTTRTLWVPKGIAEASLLEYATATGGTFATVTAGQWFLDPPETERDHGWPATRITLADNGAVPHFYPGSRVVRVTMAEGWAAVPGDIAGIAEDEVIRRYQGRGQGYTSAENAEGFVRLLRANAPDDAARLDWYRSYNVA